MQRNGLPSQLKNGLVLHLSGDVSGTTAYDISGSGNNGTLVNAPVRIRKQGYAGWTFNGTNQYISRSANVLGTSITSPYSLSISVKITTAPTTGNSMDIVMNQYLLSGSGGSRLIRYNNNGGTLRIGSVVGGTVYSEAYYNFTLDTSKFFRITSTYDGTTNRLYVNGTQVSTNTTLPTVSVNQLDRTTVGAYKGFNLDSGANFTNGIIINPIIENRALSAEEVRLDAIAFFIP